MGGYHCNVYIAICSTSSITPINLKKLFKKRNIEQNHKNDDLRFPLQVPGDRFSLSYMSIYIYDACGKDLLRLYFMA